MTRIEKSDRTQITILNNPSGRRSRGLPKLRYLYNVEGSFGRPILQRAIVPV